MTQTTLSAADVEHFLERGFVTVKGCFTRQAAQKWLDTAWVRFGVDPEDPTTWTEQRIHLSPLARVDVVGVRAAERGPPPASWWVAPIGSAVPGRGATASSRISESGPIDRGSRPSARVGGLAQGR